MIKRLYRDKHVYPYVWLDSGLHGFDSMKLLVEEKFVSREDGAEFITFPVACAIVRMSQKGKYASLHANQSTDVHLVEVQGKSKGEITIRKALNGAQIVAAGESLYPAFSDGNTTVWALCNQARGSDVEVVAKHECGVEMVLKSQCQ